MRVLYGFTTGAYSDWNVAALFETRELAEAACEAFKTHPLTREEDAGNAAVHEFPLFDAVPMVRVVDRTSSDGGRKWQESVWEWEEWDKA